MTMMTSEQCVYTASTLQQFTQFISMNAAPSDHQPSDRANRLRLWVRLQAATHRQHFLSLLSPNADTHFTGPQRVEGWVNLGDWFTRS